MACTVSTSGQCISHHCLSSTFSGAVHCLKTGCAESSTIQGKLPNFKGGKHYVKLEVMNKIIATETICWQ